jgi:hypothetical protein
MELTAISPADLGKQWERVRAGLLAVMKATTDDWLPEDVYHACKTGQAVLFVGHDGAEWLGFVVLKLVPTFHGTRMDIWCAYSSGKMPAMRLYLPKIKELAKSAGAASIGFTSARPEWTRAAQRLGFRPMQIAYELTLDKDTP